MSTTTLENSSKSHAESLIGSHAGAAFFCKQILAQGFNGGVEADVLVAGCGAGHEAIAISQKLDCHVEAVDVEDFVDPSYHEQSQVRFQVASVCELPFDDQQFDAIFYHHVIEHVDNPVQSLVELTRVLKPNGWLFIGTPNRHRLISSIGAHKQSEWEATFANKLTDNVRDWKDRLTGKFRNELGAHAGFSRGELDGMLAKHFENRLWLTEKYLRFKYASSRAASVLPLVANPATSWFAAPSIYVLCRRS
jgi:2-polyprenyl-3-methyl-5-hydroxy-6-metoxy-1,4-benzoquinol methylase